MSSSFLVKRKLKIGTCSMLEVVRVGMKGIECPALRGSKVVSVSNELR